MSVNTKAEGKLNNYKRLAGIDSIIFSVLCILLFYPPFFRGLFFQKELLITHILSFALTALWIYTKRNAKDFQLIHSWADLAALAVVFMYFISIFYGVNKRLAIAEFLKYANYFVLYLMAKDYAMNYKGTKERILHVLLLSGAIVSIIGIGSAIGTFHYNDAFVNGRIYSTLQYPNTLAAYLFALFILTMGTMQNNSSGKALYVYAALANLYIFTFIPTFSRGMWLLAPVVLLIYFILVPVGNKLRAVMYAITTIIPATFFSLVFIRGIENRHGMIQWGVVFISIVITLGFTYLGNKVTKTFSRISYKSIVITIGFLTILIGVIGGIAIRSTQPLTLSNMGNKEDNYKTVVRNISGVLKNKEYRLETDVVIKNPQNKTYAGRVDIYSVNEEGKTEVLATDYITENKRLALVFTTKDTTELIRIRFLNYYTNTEATFDKANIYDQQTGEKIKDIKLKYKYIPETLVARVNSVTVHEDSVQGRLTFYRDAFKVIKDYPVFGAGGGAWQTLYFMYQSYMYWTKQAHNYFLQLWIEIGTLGLISYLAFIGMLLLNAYKTIKNTDGKKIKILQVSILMAWLTILLHSVMDFDLSLGAMSILLWVLFGLTDQTFTIMTKYVERYSTIRYIALTVVLLLALGCISLSFGQQFAGKAIAAVAKKNIHEAIDNFETSKKFDPFTASYPADLSTLYELVARKENSYIRKAVDAAKRAAELEPYNAKILAKAGQLHIQTGQIEKGLDYLDKAVAVQPMNLENYVNQINKYLAVSNYLIDRKNMEGLERIAGRALNTLKTLNKVSEDSLQPFPFNIDLNENLQKLNYLLDFKDNLKKLKKLDKVIMYQKFDIDLDKNQMPDGTRISNTANGKLEIGKQGNYITLTNTGEDYGVFFIDNLKLKERRIYRMEIEYMSTLKDENFGIYLYDYSNGWKVIAKLENVKASKKFTKVELEEIIIPKDVIQGKQRIGIVHRGKDIGVITIKSISVIQE